jgi:XLF-Cernunnos, XRcc4-like factor, NHEJ component
MGPCSIPAWRRLPVDQTHNCAQFFTLKRHKSGLTFQVTDLVHIWTAAKTSKEELKEEAVKKRCSIDPSEDEEQYEVLVTKLEDAISGCDGASVRLIGDEQASTRVHFEIETSISLPSPLGMLEWMFQMVRQEPAVLTQELVLPTLRVIDASRRREEDLRRKIKEKDHAIGKLVDKIEGSGIDLSVVFPGFAGARRGLNARQAAKVVPGIEPLKEEVWERNLKDGDIGGVTEIVDALRDPETGEVAWRRPMNSVKEFSGDEWEGLKGRFPKGIKEFQVMAVVLQAREYWLTSQSKKLPIIVLFRTMIPILLKDPL